mmetsp:Transcript_20552/g.51743  ORF Transcript_20552/g.51743 Transcript_20552/m.51743 type:complete len:519 (-) Transcript_20552:104-1660(-)
MADSGDGVHKAGGFALSFKGKPRAVAFKVPVQPKAEEEKRELVTGISDSGRLRTAERKEKAAALVIPRQENTFQVGVGKTTTKSARAREARFLPTADDGLNSKTEDKFELAEEVPVDAKIGYGLTKFDGKAAAKEGKQNGGGGTALSQLMMSQQDKEAAQMKEDLERLPEQANMEAYEAMPIDKFGEAMLRGMGWKDGMNVGRNQSSVVQAVEYVARPGRLGLGAQPSAVDPKADRKHIRPGESRARKPDLVVARDADGRQRNVRRLDEKLVEREAPGARKGKTMWIASGEHRGFFCSVIDVDEVAGRAVVRLRPSEADVAVRTRELVEEWEREAAEAERGRPRSSHREGSREREREHKKSRHREKERDRRRDREPGEERQHKRSRRDESPPRQRGPSWLAANIRVRVVDKRLGGGKMYLKKATLLDVTAPGECCVQIDGSSETLQGVRQSQVETLVPKGHGIRVLILAGPHRGEKAKLLQRNADTGAAAVQLTADLSVVKLPLDDISEYVGPVDDDE